MLVHAIDQKPQPVRPQNCTNMCAIRAPCTHSAPLSDQLQCYEPWLVVFFLLVSFVDVSFSLESLTFKFNGFSIYIFFFLCAIKSYGWSIWCKIVFSLCFFLLLFCQSLSSRIVRHSCTWISKIKVETDTDCIWNTHTRARSLARSLATHMTIKHTK